MPGSTSGDLVTDDERADRIAALRAELERERGTTVTDSQLALVLGAKILASLPAALEKRVELARVAADTLAKMDAFFEQLATVPSDFDDLTDDEVEQWAEALDVIHHVRAQVERLAPAPRDEGDPA